MKKTITITACALFMLGAAGCRKDEKKNGLDTTPPAAGSVTEGTTDNPGTPATDPTNPTVAPGAAAPAPAPGTTTAPAPGTTTAPAPGTTTASGSMRGSTSGTTSGSGNLSGSTGGTGATGAGTGAMMNDAGAGRMPPPTGGTTGP